MLTRNLDQRQYSEGTLAPVESAHHAQTYQAPLTSGTPTLNLPHMNTMLDPSDHQTWNDGFGPLVFTDQYDNPIMDRSMFFTA